MTDKTVMPIDGQLQSHRPAKQILIDKVALTDKDLSINDNECITIMGIRGKGKSYLLKHAILPELRRLIIYDHVWGYPDDNVWDVKRNNEFKKFKDWYLIRDWHDLVLLMLDSQKDKNKRKKYYITFRPKDHSYTTFDFFCQVVWTIGGYYMVIDEMADVCTPHLITKYLSRILRVGRHKNIGLAGLTQRPASVHNMFKSQVTKGFCFRLNLPPDVKYMKDWWGEEMEMIRTLPNFHYIIWDGTRLIKMMPIKEEEDPMIIETATATHIGDPKTDEKEKEELLHVVESEEIEF